jgi:peptidoglycan/LPS O-acetylase OafA/YrhL
MNEISTAADYAARQNDHWLFIATLLILLAFAILIWRWVTADREKLARRLTEMTDKHISATEQMTAVVVNNTAALREVKEVMAACRLKQLQ